MSDRHSPDRYADAVRARRAELRARREQLLGGHRAELRTVLALNRLEATAGTAAALADLSREARGYVRGADRASGARVPALLAAALREIVATRHAAWERDLLPALRRIATERALVMDPGWPRLPPPGPLPDQPRREPVGATRSLLAGAVHGAAVWRLMLVPLAVLPLLGLPAVGGLAVAPLAAGAGVAAVVIAARSRRAAAERAALVRHVDEVLAVARSALDHDLGRRLLELDHSAGAALDAAVSRHRADVETELRRLAPDRTPAVR